METAQFQQGDVVIYDSRARKTEAYFDQYAEHDPTGAYIFPVHGDTIGIYVNTNSLTLKERGN
jgi:hypothetical protein